VQAAATELAVWERLAQEQEQRRQYQWDGEAGRACVNRPRYCRKCQAWKPPRAHHDSMTGRCVLRMDHYCM
jgi:palmitoyltransferase